MGSSISRGRKYSPTKYCSDKNPTALIGHAKYSCDDASKQRDFIEKVVCKESDVAENGMKLVDLNTDGHKVLLVKQKGVISAIGTKCTHYGAPLVHGVLGDGRVRCQWHGACFNTTTGDIEDFPGMDSLPCYEVKIENGLVTVRADKELLSANKRVKSFRATVRPKKATYIVVGGGPAGANCVETLRQEGFEGRIVFIVGEKYLPYDRVKLSKALDVEIDQIMLRSPEFYQNRNIELKLNTQIIDLIPKTKTIRLHTNEELKYDKIFLATGSSPRRLSVPGSDLKNIFVIRSFDDIRSIKEVLKKPSKVVVIGTSFIGMEAAAYFVDKAASVIIVGRDIPFKASFGEVIGKRIKRLYEEKNVHFHLAKNVEKFEGNNNILNTVVLSDGMRLPADICVVGIGVNSNTSFLNTSGVKVDKTGSVEVNEFLQTNIPGVYAGGDIALAPVLGQSAKIGHWGLANYHGHIAGLNMVGKNRPLKAVPFFWTVLFGKGFRYAGYTQKYDDVVIDGSVDDFKFIAFYCVKNYVAAVTTVNKDPLAAKFAEMLYEGKRLEKSKIQEWLS